MKYLRKYNENNSEFDVDFAIAKIKEHFTEDAVQDMLNDEINQWKPDEEDPEYYFKTGNGEAEDVIINHMTDWFEKNYNSLSDENFEKVKELILKEYEFLNFNF
jgi:hypothetical protein